jgi:hypothetical protein
LLGEPSGEERDSRSIPTSFERCALFSIVRALWPQSAPAEWVKCKFDDYRNLVNPKIVLFARPYREGLQRLAAGSGYFGVVDKMSHWFRSDLTNGSIFSFSIPRRF